MEFVPCFIWYFENNMITSHIIVGCHLYVLLMSHWKGFGGRQFNQRDLHWLIYFVTWLNELNKQTYRTQFHSILYCLYVADPDTFLASNSVLGTLFFLCAQLVYSVMVKKKLSCHLINIVKLKFWVLIVLPKLHSAPLNTRFSTFFVYWEQHEYKSNNCGMSSVVIFFSFFFLLDLHER